MTSYGKKTAVRIELMKMSKTTTINITERKGQNVYGRNTWNEICKSFIGENILMKYANNFRI